MSFIVLQKNVMSKETLTNIKLSFVRHFENKNPSKLGNRAKKIALYHGTHPVTKANMASFKEKISIFNVLDPMEN